MNNCSASQQHDDGVFMGCWLLLLLLLVVVVILS